MEERTGRIYDDVDPKDAKRRGLAPIAPAEVARVKAMPHGQRLAWAAARKKECQKRRKAARAARKKTRRSRR